MLGLGNGRRGMKSPPLLVAVLLACVLVLGINYWISSSRSIELQSRLMELEGRIRRAAAERGAVEIKKNEFEEKLEKQKGQIDNIQSLHRTQLESFNIRCTNDKAILVKNLTFKDQLLSKLQGDLTELEKQYNALQQQMDTFRDSQSRKLNFELEQCSNKMKEINDQCEERLKKLQVNIGKKVDIEERAEPEVEKEDESQKQETNQLNSDLLEENTRNVNNIVPEAPIPTSNIRDAQSNLMKVDHGEKKNSNIASFNEVNHLAKGGPEAHVPPQNPSKAPNEVLVLPPEPGKEPDSYEQNDKMEAAEEDEQITELTAGQEGKNEINNEEVEREQLLNMDDQEEKEMALQDNDQGNNEQDEDNADAKLPDYNGEAGNEPEPEAKKQAELAGNDLNLKGPIDKDNTMDDLELDRQKEDLEQRLK